MSKIRLNLITRSGTRLCLQEFTVAHFKEANADRDEGRMLTYLSTMLPRGYCFTGKAMNILCERLAALRNDRKEVTVSVDVEYNGSDYLIESKPSAPATDSALKQVRAERDQARADFKDTEKKRAEAEKRLKASEQNVKTFSAENARLTSQNGELLRENKRLSDDASLYKKKYEDVAAEVKDLREKLRAYERKQRQSSVDKDVFG